jgi:hypothetical protein
MFSWKPRSRPVAARIEDSARFSVRVLIPVYRQPEPRPDSAAAETPTLPHSREA